MDLRILAVATPIFLALGWAASRIGRAAFGQLQAAFKQYKTNQTQ